MKAEESSKVTLITVSGTKAWQKWIIWDDTSHAERTKTSLFCFTIHLYPFMLCIMHFMVGKSAQVSTLLYIVVINAVF